ncbi:hypothetical protein A2W14_04510 [Candidatus Gottesmanbacteria bacterium RBG_16_37_8]|uniref:DUF5652 domain-containing protein n=1 Tax=Candidatus Gottesmanbacteria bacterium RBG_16_37_8 TaxID=1798371 RepID=A0A1F5YSM6_9BACT|nr:MAG: hypothetical protein A2W14_04510 [Candidatus Gottesmanbacteria bacterium RBG_16_37_8]
MSGLQQAPGWVYPLIIIDLVMKGYGLWRSAKNDQKYWFMAILVINSAGILPLIYFLFFQKGIKIGSKNWLKQAVSGSNK